MKHSREEHPEESSGFLQSDNSLQSDSSLQSDDSLQPDDTTGREGSASSLAVTPNSSPQEAEGAVSDAPNPLQEEFTESEEPLPSIANKSRSYSKIRIVAMIAVVLVVLSAALVYVWRTYWQEDSLQLEPDGTLQHNEAPVEGVAFDLWLKSPKAEDSSLKFTADQRVTVEDRCFTATTGYSVLANGELKLEKLEPVIQEDKVSTSACGQSVASEVFETSKVAFDADSDAWVALDAQQQVVASELTEVSFEQGS